MKLSVLTKNNSPVQLNGQSVKIIDQWRIGGRWWLGERPRDYFRIEQAGKLLDIYRTPGGGGELWLLAKNHD